MTFLAVSPSLPRFEQTKAVPKFWPFETSIYAAQDMEMSRHALRQELHLKGCFRPGNFPVTEEKFDSKVRQKPNEGDQP